VAVSCQCQAAGTPGQRNIKLSAIASGDTVARVELRQLNTFVTVAEEGSFTRAAERLHVVQSAVSAGVRNLERELGAALFDRSTRKVQLTDAGIALLPEARATLAASVAAREAVEQVCGGLRGTIALGTMQAQVWHAIDVSGVVAAFIADHPAVEVKIRQGSSSDMARQVRDGELDLALVALPGRGVPGVQLTPLAREPIVLAVPTGHPLAAHPDVDLATLGEQTLVDLPSGYGTRIAIDQSFADAGVTRTVTYEVNDIATMIEFIRNGLAVGMIPASLAETTDDIVCVAIRDHPPEFETALAVPSNRRLSAATQAMVDTIRRHVGV